MIAPIYINGIIGDDSGTTLLDVVGAVQRNQDATGYRVYINSQGGVCDVGYAIHDYLVSLKDKHITTVANGICASIATVIFLAGSERLINPTAQFMIHSPWADGVTGNASELEIASMVMRDEENKLIKFYTSKTSINAQGIESLLKQETYMTAEQAIELGFATGYAEPLKAVAMINTNPIIMKLQDKIDELIGLFKKKNSTQLTTGDGKILTIEYPDGVEDGKIEVGDMVSVDGQPANGDIVLADGSSIKVESGKVIEVMPSSSASQNPDELVNELKSQLESANAELKVLREEKEAIGSRLALLEEAIEKSKVKFVPQAKAPFQSQDQPEKKNAFALVLENIKKQNQK